MLFYMIFPAIAAGGAVVMDIQRAKVDNAWLLFCLVISLTVRAYGERNGRVHSLELRSMHPLSGTWLAVSIQNAGRWRHQAFLCYGKRTGTGDNS